VVRCPVQRAARVGKQPPQDRDALRIDRFGTSQASTEPLITPLASISSGA